VNGDAGMVFHWKTDSKAIFTDSLGNKTSDTLKGTVFIQWPKTAGTAQYNLSVTGEMSGCYTETKSLTVVVNPATSVNLGGPFAFCQGDSHTFDVTGYNTVQWQNGENNTTYIADSAQTVWVKVANTYGCLASDTSLVTVYPKPIVNLGNDTALCFGQVLMLDAGNPGSTYQWYDYNKSILSGSENYVATEKDSFLTVLVTNKNSCVSSDTIHILSCQKTFNANEIPSAFTPNGDGMNDYWIIPNIAQYTKAIVEVYDRWGRLEFRSKPGYTEPWDGKTKNGYVPMDAYFFIINLNVNGISPFTGSITVIR
jgi:gliding motility-associated-like protein